MALERILKIFFFLKPVTEYLFGKTNRNRERKGGKGTKVYIVAICTMLFVAFFVTYVPKKKKFK